MVNVHPIINDSDGNAFAASDFVRRLDVREHQPATRSPWSSSNATAREKCPCAHGGE
jgi:hypothetical protein